MTSIPFAVSLLACAIGCMASPGGVRPSAGPGTSKPPAQGQGAPSAGGGGTQVFPNPNLPVMLPPQLGAPPRDSGDDPEFPRELQHTGLTYVVRAKICVSKTGTVDNMSIVKGSDMAERARADEAEQDDFALHCSVVVAEFEVEAVRVHEQAVRDCADRHDGEERVAQSTAAQAQDVERAVRVTDGA